MLTVLTCGIKSVAQTTSNPEPKKDSTTFAKRAVASVADKFAIARPFNIEYTLTAPYRFSSEKNNTSLPDGKVTSFQQLRASTNINFIKRKTWMLGTTLGYRLTSSETEVSTTGSPMVTIAGDHHYVFGTLNFTYFSTIFKKRSFFSSSFFVDGSEKQLERIKGIFTGTMVLKANQKTKMTAGFLVNLDASAQSPVIPTFSYEHKFNNGLIVDIALPRTIYLRKFIANKGRISLGTALDQTSFYLYNLDGSNQKYEYRQLDINSGLVYEHLLGKHFMLTAKSGVKLSPEGRIFKKQDSYADPVYQIGPDPAFYFNIGLSFNPFTLFGKN